jgi:anti-sigma regulatory factor (Ser/Thr protein kinase)
VRYERTFERSTPSVRQVRRFLTEAVDGVPADLVDSVVLMGAELATNVVRHTDSPDYVVAVERTDDAIDVTVSDHGGGTPVLRSPSASEPTGRGVRIVATLSDEWGFTVDETAHRTDVRFRVYLPPLGGDRRAVQARASDAVAPISSGAVGAGGALGALDALGAPGARDERAGSSDQTTYTVRTTSSMVVTSRATSSAASSPMVRMPACTASSRTAFGVAPATMAWRTSSVTSSTS